MDSIALTISIAVGLTTLITFLATLRTYVSTAATKRYAAEEAMREIRQSLSDLQTSVQLSSRTNDFQFNTILMKLAEINTRIDNTTITKNPKND